MHNSKHQLSFLSLNACSNSWWNFFYSLGLMALGIERCLDFRVALPLPLITQLMHAAIRVHAARQTLFVFSNNTNFAGFVWVGVVGAFSNACFVAWLGLKDVAVCDLFCCNCILSFA